MSDGSAGSLAASNVALPTPTGRKAHSNTPPLPHTGPVQSTPSRFEMINVTFSIGI